LASVEEIARRGSSCSSSDARAENGAVVSVGLMTPPVMAGCRYQLAGHSSAEKRALPLTIFFFAIFSLRISFQFFFFAFFFCGNSF
jgi:hypothetical protein